MSYSYTKEEKTVKKVLSVFLALFMIATTFSFIALPTLAVSKESATEYASVYNGGEMDFSWYGTGFDMLGNHVPDDPKATEFTIRSAAQLEAFAYMVGYEFNQFRGVTIKLGCDIV